MSVVKMYKNGLINQLQARVAQVLDICGLQICKTQIEATACDVSGLFRLT